MFSPTFATSSVRAVSTMRPSENVSDESASTSSTLLANAASATASANETKFSSLATKSVSELISAMAAVTVFAPFRCCAAEWHKF